MVAPSKGALSRAVDPATVPYEFGDVYYTDALFPAAVAELGTAVHPSRPRGVVVQINPFQVNPTTGLLRFHRKVTVEIVRVAAGGENTLPPSARRAAGGSDVPGAPAPPLPQLSRGGGSGLVRRGRRTADHRLRPRGSRTSTPSSRTRRRAALPTKRRRDLHCRQRRGLDQNLHPERVQQPEPGVRAPRRRRGAGGDAHPSRELRAGRRRPAVLETGRGG